MKKAILLILPILISGCVTIQPIEEIRFNYKPNSGYFTLPAIGQMATVEIGDRLITSGYRTSYKALDVANALDIKTAGGELAYSVPSGKYLKTGDSSIGETYDVKDQYSAFRVASHGKHYAPIALTLKNQKVCVIEEATQIERCGESPESKLAVVHRSTDHSFQRTLIYSGKIGNKITIGYREFKDDFAREAFSNEANYDLSESKVVGYKGARLEISSADNTSITYKILSDFK